MFYLAAYQKEEEHFSSGQEVPLYSFSCSLPENLYSQYCCCCCCCCRFSRVQLSATPQTTAHQAPPSLGFSRQEYWSGLPFPSMHACMLSRFSRVRLCETLWAAAHQAPLSMGFSRQEYWSGLPSPSPTVSTRLEKSLISPVSMKSYA